MSDVSERCRAEQGVHDRMGQDIRIAVSVQTGGVRDLHPADDALSALFQAVYVVSVSDSHPMRSLIIRSPIRRSSCVVILMLL